MSCVPIIPLISKKCFQVVGYTEEKCEIVNHDHLLMGMFFAILKFCFWGFCGDSLFLGGFG